MKKFNTQYTYTQSEIEAKKATTYFVRTAHLNFWQPVFAAWAPPLIGILLL